VAVPIDGNEAVARVAHALSETIALYPITPASPMGELADARSAAGRANVWGVVPTVAQLQSGGRPGRVRAGQLPRDPDAVLEPAPRLVSRA